MNHPPSTREVRISTLLAAGVHLGHATALWNASTQPFIYGVHRGIHIISLDKTLGYLRRASTVVREIVRRQGIVVFIGTRKGQERYVTAAAEQCGAYHIFDRWIPGTITNGDRVLAGGQLKRTGDTATKIPASVRPDLVILLNPLENQIALKECAKNRIPTIGIIDTDADPTWVTYPIPGNDDSLRSVGLIAGVLGQAGHDGVAAREHQ